MAKTMKTPVRKPVHAQAKPFALVCTAAEFEIQAAGEGEGEPKLPKFSMLAYTGVPMRVRGYAHPIVVDLSTTTSDPSIPIHFNHDPDRMVGHGTPEISAQRIKLTGVVSHDGPDAQRVVNSGKNGFPWKSSIGADPGEVELVEAGSKVKVNGRIWSGPVYVSRQNVLGEISFVSKGADRNASASVSASAQTHKESTMEFEQWLEANEWNPETITAGQRKFLEAAFQLEQAETARKPARRAGRVRVTASGDEEDEDDDEELDPVQKLRASAAEEFDRIAAVQKLAKGHPDIAAQSIKEGWTLEKTELEVIKASRAHPPAIHAGNPQVNAQVVEASLLIAGGIDEERVGKMFDEKTMNEAVSAKHRDASLHSLMDLTIHASGGHFSGNRKTNGFIRAALTANKTIQADGFTTLSLSNILENVANKTLIASYQAVETVWQYFCAVRSNSDFKPASRYRLDASGAFRKVGPDGELKMIGLTDAKYSNTLETYGAIIALTRQMMINDDLGAFMEIPTILGTMSSTRLEEAVFVLLLSNPGNFFGSGNKNLITDVLAIAGLTAARQKFRNRVDANKKPILASAQILLVGTPLDQTADNLWAQDKVLVTTTADKPQFANNPHKGLFRPYVSPYINNTDITDEAGKPLSGQSDTQWYLFADPGVRAAMSVAFLNGSRTPTVESAETDFETLGMQWRAYQDFGVAMEDSVGALKSTGAGS